MRKLLAREVPTGVAIMHKYERHAAPRVRIGSTAWLKVSSMHTTSFLSMGGAIERDGGYLQRCHYFALEKV